MASDWIEWNGGECPVDRHSFVDVKFRSGATSFGAEAYTWAWSKEDTTGDIIAYRLHQVEEVKPFAADDGWCEWNGGDLPCHPETIVDVMLQNGEVHIGDTAADWVWKRTGDIDDIVKYRVHNAPNEDGVWIKCSDRMPEPDQEVIVWDKGRGKVQSGMILKLGYNRALGNVFVDFNEEYYTVTNVEFWQALPAPPKGE